MCSLVANYDSDEEQQSGAPKVAENKSKKVAENSSEFGWSLMQANVQRDMEISDDDTLREEEIIPAKQLRRKKRIDFATSSANRFLPSTTGTQVEEINNPKTESSVINDKKLKLLNLESVTLPSHNFTSNNQVVIAKGCDEEKDLDIQLKLNECLCKLSSLIQRNCDNVEKAAAMLMKLQVLKDAWHASALDSCYFCSQLDSILEVLQPNSIQIKAESSSHVPQQPLFPITKNEASVDQPEHSILEPPGLNPQPPPPPPEDEYMPAPPPPPPPPEVDEQLGHELDSFYSEMAGIEAAFDQKKEDTPAATGKAPNAEVDPSKDEVPPEPVEMVNKNRKGRISSSVGMKRKNVSSLMEKWNKVKKEWND